MICFLIHYKLRGSIEPTGLNIVSHSPVSAKTLDSLYSALAKDAALKLGRLVRTDEIVIANIIPIPSGEPTATQIGGS